MEIPIATSLSDIYPDDALPSQRARWEELFAKFAQEYGHAADFVSRSPGRVNLIGEHIDYSLYQVLPMAITFDSLVAVAVHPPPNGSTSNIRIANVDTSRFPTRTFEVPVKGDIDIDTTAHEWTNYFKAGLNGAFQLLRKLNADFVPVGMDVVVSGSVPTGSGLSSSTAFVCASALAVMVANGVQHIDKNDLCELTIISERGIGVNSGGMDQVASVFSLRGSATYISFVPKLVVEPLQFPATDPELTFIITQSYVESLKAVTAPMYYNIRVTECSLAAAVLAKALGLPELPLDTSPLKISLRGFQNTYFQTQHGIPDNYEISHAEFESQLEQLVALVEKHLPKDGYTREEIADILDISKSALDERYFARIAVKTDQLKLRQRALHVYGEALRVVKFKTKLSSHQPSASSGDALLQELGTLMNNAQHSNKELYECSCAELDEICQIAREAGAYGSRLTGAGWGGCCVHLVPKDKLGQVKQALEERYYRKRWPDMSDQKLSDAVVVSEPGSGSYVYRKS
ncbi:Galactokinase [Microthyrium microscopicum]|uniref:Galactokinase n=1 Tax=Microthyrium microscopicum TaxID=703497 RepID=A0A6A6UKA1_9PEZI|nr:Galactokinase [Microthyrium microscopicum]